MPLALLLALAKVKISNFALQEERVAQTGREWSVFPPFNLHFREKFFLPSQLNEKVVSTLRTLVRVVHVAHTKWYSTHC